METLIQADVFFFISSVSLMAITTLILLILFQITKILAQIREFLESITHGTQALADDLGQVRSKLNEKGLMTGMIISIMAAIMGSKNKKGKQEDSSN